MRLPGKISLTGAVLFILVGILLWGGFNTAMEATNTLDFCISCHEMRDTVYQEYRHSVHYANASGVMATCPDCHVPREWGPKVVRKIQASNELYHWLIGSIDTPEKFAARRPALADHVWTAMKRTDSRECRNCHRFSAMKIAEQGRFAADRHQRALKAGGTCIDCHQGISHHLPPLKPLSEDPDLELGEEILETCAGCHGDRGQGTPDGEYPRLAGLDEHYIARQIKLFKTRKRINIPMIPYANDRELPDEDVVAIASYLSRIELPTRLEPVEAPQAGFDALARLEASKAVLNIPRYPGDAEAGGRIYRRECAGCHGPDGRGIPQKGAPMLTGQHSAYLLRQIGRIRKGERPHDAETDGEIFGRFGDDEIRDILAWLSLQDD